MSYHVFIERAQDPGNVAQVAAAIAQRYGMPVDAISQRMGAGRFRVKADVDLDTAKAFAADLHKLGAIAAVVDASTGQPVPERATAQTIAKPPERATAQTIAKPAGIPSGGHRVRAPAVGAPNPAVPTPAAAGTPAPAQRNADELASGLSAAFSGTHEVQNLGAIESGEFNLATLDDADDLPTSLDEPTPTPPPAPGSFAPSDDGEEQLVVLEDGAPKQQAPPAPAAGGAAVAPPADEFAPPSEDSLVDLDDSTFEVEDTPLPPKPSSAPSAAFTEAQRFSQELAVQQGNAEPAAAEQTGRTAKQSVDLRQQFREMFVDRPRVRFGVGVVLMIMLAWIPAKIFWGSKVASAQAELNVTLQETVTLARNDEAVWTDFEDIVRKERELAGSRLFNKRITAVMIWLGLVGILGFVYFRKIPWDDL